MAEEALRGMVLSAESAEVATLAAASGRGLFVFGPPGNGKTTLGRALRNLMAGPLWVPHALAVDNSIIRFFDSQMHATLPGMEQDGRVDQRWIRIQRPFIMTGGEMTLQDLDLAYQPSLKCYEAPAHVKANGGVFMIDDFGRQRVDTQQMLNRWIVPLEERVDFLTLLSGQKIRMPFKLLLIIATNLTPSDVADPAFLRRMGYRLRIDNPSVEDYRRIFTRYADSRQIELAPGVLEHILARYQGEQRSLRGCEPRDLIERSLDIIRLRAAPRRLDAAIADTAWRGYFGGLAEPALA
jgi:predicted ATPase with chaperone activity